MQRRNELIQKESPWKVKEQGNETGFWGLPKSFKKLNEPTSEIKAESKLHQLLGMLETPNRFNHETSGKPTNEEINENFLNLNQGQGLVKPSKSHDTNSFFQLKSQPKP